MLQVQKWMSIEIPFEPKAEIHNIEEALMDVTFVNRDTKKELKMPAFWDIDKWYVRFAPNELGIWDYTVTCSGKVDIGLNGVKGELECIPYTGEYEIYKRGFVKTIPDTRYFVYDDGTPFFYLGDTHWTMPMEEIDEAGPHAYGIETDSHFKYIVDVRVAQGFTVYQSEPIGHSYNIMDGIDEKDVLGFRHMDRYFKYIAEKGLLHANAQLIFPGEVKEPMFDDNFVYHVTRYWVARYASYPVLWTLGQEIDASFFNKCGMTPENNPYKVMCKYIYELDPYQHPCTGHQENAAICGAKGGSVAECWGYTMTSKPSSFYGMKEHTWWGVQWRPEVNKQHVFSIPKDYWFNGEGKVSINYETRYDYLYTKNFGARANGYISILNGMFGYGYGCADMWYYNGRYSFNEDTSDGVDNVTRFEKEVPWGLMLKMPINEQLTYMRNFFEGFDWWKLVPDFDSKEYYRNTRDDVFYTAAHINSDLYVVYYYNRNNNCDGVLNKLENVPYIAQWFDPQTGEYTDIAEFTPYDGHFAITTKPSRFDLILIVKKK